MLKQEGYKTCHAGKWHLGSGSNSGPEIMGFDVNIGGNQAGAPRSYFSPYHNTNLPDGPDGEHITDRITSDSIEFIKQNKNDPFFLYLSFYAVHVPLQAKEELKEKYEKKPKGERHNHTTYASMVENTDTNIGRVLSTLDQLGLRDDTVVLFYSDNGGYGPATTMEPLRGAKGMLYEGGIRVPFTVRYPGHAQAGSTCETPVIGVDFFPTIKEISHSTIDENHILDGESILPLLQTGTLNRDSIYWHFPAYLEAYKKTTGPWRTTPAGAIRSGDYKLIEYFEDNRLELYDLKNDIGETRDLSKKMPDIADRLQQKLQQWRSNIQAPVPTELNLEYVAK
jgi:arylsulfatase A-like enzyme